MLLYTGLPRHHLSVLVNTPWHCGHNSAAGPVTATVNCLGRGGRGPGVTVRVGSLCHPLLAYCQPVVGGVWLGLPLSSQPLFAPGVELTHHLPSSSHTQDTKHVKDNLFYQARIDIPRGKIVLIQDKTEEVIFVNPASV